MVIIVVITIKVSYPCAIYRDTGACVKERRD